MSKIKIEIELGNAAMRTARDAERALERTWARISQHVDPISLLRGEGVVVRDRNGNSIGRLWIERDNE